MKFFRLEKILIIIAVAAAFLAGHYIKLTATTPLISQFRPVRASDSEYPLINPLLLYQLPSSADLPQYQPLASELKDKVSVLTSQGKATQISVYYRDLNEGHWVGVNENDEYTPASLMKVVILVAYLKEAETNPKILNTQMTFTSTIQSLLNALPYDQITSLKLGSNYTVDQLLRLMITDSDNGAAYTLLSGINNAVLSQLYNTLGLGNPAADGRSYVISAQSYSLFFRILYNATYLSKEMSERAMELLSEATFKDGLVAGVDSGIRVAHKYGESAATDSKGTIINVELHDCGVVYETARPYFICVMTRGSNISDLKEVIKEISAAVFQKVKSDNLGS